LELVEVVEEVEVLIGRDCAGRRDEERGLVVKDAGAWEDCESRCWAIDRCGGWVLEIGGSQESAGGSAGYDGWRRSGVWVEAGGGMSWLGSSLELKRLMGLREGL
ncbi:hypothetical protein LINPERHAP2_LOCUS14100, partial [Linum perenne]